MHVCVCVCVCVCRLLYICFVLKLCLVLLTWNVIAARGAFIVIFTSLYAGKDNQGDTNQLCIDDDLQEVYSQLLPAAKDWFDMGLALGIKVDILEGIDSNKDTDKARLRGMLPHWLRSSKSPTWSDICNVLRSNTVQQDNLAYTIEGTYTKVTFSKG